MSGEDIIPLPSGSPATKTSMLAQAFKKLSPLYHGVKAWAYQYPVVFKTLQKARHLVKFTYPQSAIAHRYLDGLRGIEIGASSFNPFGLNTLNVNHAMPEAYDYQRHELSLVGHTAGIGIVALGDALPFADNSSDFVLASHVIEHFYDPITAMREWYRVTRPKGYVFLMVPHRDRNGFDKVRPRTPLNELIARHAAGKPNTPSEEHLCFWTTDDFLAFCTYLDMPVIEYQDRDDKAGNGFTIVIQKPAAA